MKKIFRTVAALAVVMFAGCTTDLENEVAAPGVGAGQTTVTVGIADTKTYIGELIDGARKVYWNSDDQIAINGVASSAIERNEEKTQAVFSFDAELTHPYSVLYPAESYKDAQTITLPAVQESATDSYGKDAAPMAAYAEAEGTVQLHHLAGVVRLQVKLPAESKHSYHQLNKIELRGKAGEQVSGDFAIDYQAVTLTSASTAEADKVVAAKANKTLSAEEAQDVFVVVPAQEYAEGFTVRLIDDAGHYMDIASKAMTIAKGEIKAMPVVEFVPTGTLVGVEIASAQDLVAFANAYNAGEYAEVNPLIVTLKNDIEFDDETNAAWTPIGTTTYQAEGNVDFGFAGCFDGAGFSIKNWHQTNKPLFMMTRDAIVKDLTIDATSSMTFSLNIIAESRYGVIIGDAFSTVVENCTNNAPVVLDNCLADGLAVRLDVAGVVARTNEQCQVVGCTNNGSIEAMSTCNFGLSNGAIPKATVYIGGICGYSRCDLLNCSNTGAITTSYNVQTKATAGVAGRVTGTGSLVNCTNSGTITDNSIRKPSDIGINDYNRYLYLGGVVGLPACNVTNCSNSGIVTAGTNVKAVYVGGVIAYSNSEVGVYDNITNTGAVSTTSDARYPYVGGILGYCKTPYLTNIKNEGAVSVGRTETSNTVVGAVGGIIGFLATSLDGTNTIENSGAVSYTNENVGWNYVGVGGIAGLSEIAGATLSNVKNTGLVTATAPSGKLYHNLHVGGILGLAVKSITVTNTTHEGGVRFYTNKSDELHYNICVGGIVGSHIDGQALTVTNSENKGYAAVVGNSNGVYQAIALGGIAGALVGGDSSISNCTVTGRVGNSRQNNNATTFTIRASGGGATQIGGIAGYVEGTADNLISVTNCSFNNNGNLENFVINTSYAIYALRGVVGGLVGTAKYADIKQNTCVARLYLTNTTMLAGLVGYLQNSNLEACSLVNTEVLTKSANGSGGLVAKSVASTVKNNIINNSSVTTSGTATKHGVLAGISDADSSFTDNQVNGTFQGAAITLESVMVANGTPTITGTEIYEE